MEHQEISRRATCNDDNNHVIIILRILEVGLIFEYLRTIGIVNILTSSHQLLCFTGI